MNPGEKAKQIIDKFLPLVEAFTEIGRLENAKKCALIAVDELIESHLVLSTTHDLKPSIRCKRYWQEVKQEIQNYEPNI